GRSRQRRPVPDCNLSGGNPHNGTGLRGREQSMSVRAEADTGDDVACPSWGKHFHPAPRVPEFHFASLAEFLLTAGGGKTPTIGAEGQVPDWVRGALKAHYLTPGRYFVEGHCPV